MAMGTLMCGVLAIYESIMVTERRAQDLMHFLVSWHCQCKSVSAVLKFLGLKKLHVSKWPCGVCCLLSLCKSHPQLEIIWNRHFRLVGNFQCGICKPQRCIILKKSLLKNLFATYAALSVWLIGICIIVTIGCNSSMSHLVMMGLKSVYCVNTSDCCGWFLVQRFVLTNVLPINNLFSLWDNREAKLLFHGNFQYSPFGIFPSGMLCLILGSEFSHKCNNNGSIVQLFLLPR